MKIKQIVRTVAASFMMMAAIVLPALLISTSISTQTAYAATTATGESDPLLVLTALMIMFLPLFGVPFLLKFSGGLLGRIGAFVNNPNKGPFDKMRKSAEGYSQFRQNKAKGRIFKGNASRTQRGLGFAGIQRHKQKKDRERAGVEREANRAATAWTADRLVNDKKFREKAAGGTYMQGARGTDEFEAAAARTRALGEAELDKLIGEETKAGIVTIRNMQFGNSGLKSLATTGTGLSQVGEARQSQGLSTKGHELSGDFYQKSALAMATSEARIPILEAAIDAAGDPKKMSKGVRETFSYQLGDAYSTLKAKAHYLNDDAIKQSILTGQPVTPQLKQEASARALSSLTKTVYAGQEAIEYNHFIDGVASRTVTNGQMATNIKLARETLADGNLTQFMNPDKTEALTKIAAMPLPVVTPANANATIAYSPIAPGATPRGFVGPLPPPAGPAPGGGGPGPAPGGAPAGPRPGPAPGGAPAGGAAQPMPPAGPAPGGGAAGAYATPPATPGGGWTNWTSAGTATGPTATSYTPAAPAPATPPPTSSTPSAPTSPSTSPVFGPAPPPSPSAGSAPAIPPAPATPPISRAPSGSGGAIPRADRGLGWNPVQIQQPTPPTTPPGNTPSATPDNDNNDDDSNT